VAAVHLDPRPQAPLSLRVADVTAQSRDAMLWLDSGSLCLSLCLFMSVCLSPSLSLSLPPVLPSSARLDLNSGPCTC
jgi:hypothetical protein